MNFYQHTDISGDIKENNNLIKSEYNLIIFTLKKNKEQNEKNVNLTKLIKSIKNK